VALHQTLGCGLLSRSLLPSTRCGVRASSGAGASTPCIQCGSCSNDSSGVSRFAAPHLLIVCCYSLVVQVGSKVMCMAWTADGMLLALGLYDGSISLRDKAGTEKLKFAASSSPVWSLAWSPGVSSARGVQQGIVFRQGGDRSAVGAVQWPDNCVMCGMHVHAAFGLNNCSR
jgi:WD40 repeat protein